MAQDLPVVELFAGGGGAALGLHRAGVGPALMVEWNPKAASTLRKAVKDGLLAGKVVEADVNKVRYRKYLSAPPFLLWSSFPCSPFSSSGKRLLEGDPRNQWPATSTAIKKLKPTWFVGENVMGLVQGRGKTKSYCDREILPFLRSHFPWTAAWVLDAADWGVPQRRKRVFLIGGPFHIEPPKPTHQDPELSGWWSASKQKRRKLRKPWISLAEALEHDPWDNFEAMYSGFRESELDAMEDRERAEELRDHGHDDWWCVSCQQPISYQAPSTPVYEGTHPWHPAAGKGESVKEPGVILLDPSAAWSSAEINPASGTEWGCQCPMPSDAENLLAEPAPTMTGGEKSHVSARSIISASASKREQLLWALLMYRGGPTVREAAKLGGFPPNWPFQGANVHAYRQVANSVAPPVAEAIGRTILEATPDFLSELGGLL